MSEPARGDAAAPPHEEWRGRWFDGLTPSPRPVRVRVGPDGVRLDSENAPAMSALWRHDAIQLIRGQAAGEPIQLEHHGTVAEALIVDDPKFLKSLRAVAPAGSRVRRSAGARSSVRSLVVLTLALAIGLFAAYRWGIPAAARLAADHVPESWEREFGARATASLAPASRRIEDDEVVEPLRSILDRVAQASGSSAERYTLIVARLGEPNAFAAPGRFVVVGVELVRVLETPEQLAAVLAHEVQHVELRHTTRGVFKQYGLTALLSLAGGDGSALGQVAGLAGELGSLSYSREDEQAADVGAAHALLRLGIHPDALAEALVRLNAVTGRSDLPSFLSSHPASSDRREAVRRATRGEALVPQPPILTADQWAALKSAVAARP